MAELLFTTQAFQPQGLPTPNVPMLLDAKMRLVEPACAWLLHVALVRGRTRSKETWRTYGEALYDWWQTLEANGWTWDTVGSREITAYRNRMLEGASDHTSRPYSRATGSCSRTGHCRDAVATPRHRRGGTRTDQ